MTPFRFGPPDRQLFGIYHPAALSAGPSTGLLMCNPFGQEAVRTHRLQQVLAERLARQGLHVLRFDYQGTGDSAGDDTLGQLDLWQADILAAHHELQRRAMCQRTVWLGMRLGASLAALASTRTQHKPNRLVLWEPIAHGPTYLEAQRTAHREALASSFSIVPKAYRTAPRYEALGFGISPVLHEQLLLLNATNWPALRVPELSLITPSQSPDQAVWAQWLARHEGQHQRVVLDHHFDWTSEEALNNALVPHDALNLLASLVEARP